MVKIVITGDMTPEEINQAFAAALDPMKRAIEQIADTASAGSVEAANVDLVKEAGRRMTLDAEAQQPVLKPTRRRRKKSR